MKIALITAGAAGMYCGSCMRDNTLAAALIKLGHDTLLIPTYTPIRTDEENISETRVFMGGINVFLQQQFWLFRHTPWLLDRLLNFPRLLRWVSPLAARTKAAKLGSLTISMLKGPRGKQRKEVRKLVEWLATDFKPDVVLLTNVLLSGFVPELKKAWPAPVVGVLQGDDIFLEALPETDRRRCVELIHENDPAFAGYISTSRFYADAMAPYLKLPREKIQVVYPGINLKGHGGPREHRSAPPYIIGYFARICREKGFHHIVEAFRLIREMPNAPECRLKVSGWLGENNRPFFDEQMLKLRFAGLAEFVEHVDCPTHEQKVAFLQSVDVLSVPTTYHEPKGLYILEALANGTPVVQPAHGSFPELIEATNGGELVPPDDPAALANAIVKLLNDPARRRELAERGGRAVNEIFTAEAMALNTLSVLEQIVKKSGQ
ncbi:glycosyltransferase family 4 protein [Zavarzinella formosa]|uniref:glycosyltransferase family 4 protein n=1 Tax=Zavarzinella formosa TaxID=360055 RepID=UPI0002F84432|nr:glycosyltransferase family 4 protein [Zavarzinella formosa]